MATHAQRGLARAHEGPAQMDAYDVVPFRRTQVIQRLETRNARVVDQHVNRTERRDRLVHEAYDVRLLAHVGAHERGVTAATANGCRVSFAVLCVQICQYDL